MAVKRHYCLMAVDNLSQPRAAEKWKNFMAFAFHGFADRRIVGDNHDFWRAEHRKGTFQLERLIEACLDKSFNLFFPKRCQHTPAKAAGKTLGSGKPHAITFIAAAI